MPTVVVEDFKAGVDRRKSRAAGVPGSLWECINAHLTRGGEIEKRKKFVTKYALPEGTFGMRVLDAVYVFGSTDPATFSPAMPAGVTYQRLVHPGGSAMTAILDAVPFAGAMFAVAQYADGSIHYFNNGTRVTAWDDGVIRSWQSSFTAIAANIAALINANATEVVTATAAGNVITITNKVVNVGTTISAAAVNGDGNAANDQTATALVTVAHGVGTAQVVTVTLGGTEEIGDRFAVTIGDNEYGAGGNPATKATRLIVHKSKIYAIAGSIVYFCAIEDATVWREGVNGAGFFNVSTQGSGNLEIVAVAEYQTGLAFFGKREIQTWTLDVNPTLNSVQNNLKNTGSISPFGALAFGNNDTFYLSRSGLRSIRARDSSGAPFVNDVGNSIDPLLLDVIANATADQIAAVRMIIEPVDGRLWVWIADYLFVFSYFPGGKISAWSWYVPGFAPGELEIFDHATYVRSGDTIYVYGGDTGQEYDADSADNYPVTVTMPYMHAQRISDDKDARAYDMLITNTWLVEVLTDIRNPLIKEVCGTISEATYPDSDFAMAVGSTHFAPRLVCETAGPATIANMALSFDLRKR